MAEPWKPIQDPGDLRTEEQVRLAIWRIHDWINTAARKGWNDRFVPEFATHTHTESDITDLEHDPDITGRTALSAVPALDDEFILYDTSATTNKKVDWQYLRGVITQDVAAAGSDIDGATDIVAQFVKINAVTAGSAAGAQLPDWGQGAKVIVENADGADTLKLYPHSGSGTINGAGGGASIDVTAGSWAICVLEDGTDWRVKVF